MKKVGQIVMITKDNDNDCYDAYRGLLLEITHIATSVKQHPGYDESMDKMPLFDLKVFETGKDVPFSLYDYEVSAPH